MDLQLQTAISLVNQISENDMPMISLPLLEKLSNRCQHLLRIKQNAVQLVESIPKEIWYSIFYFSIQTFVSADTRAQQLLLIGLVCSRWNPIIKRLFKQSFYHLHTSADRFLCRFPEIQTLSVQCPYGGPPQITEKSIKNLTQLTHLEIKNCSFAQTEYFKLLPTFTSLTSLHMCDVSVLPPLNGRLGIRYLSTTFHGFLPQLPCLTDLSYSGPICMKFMEELAKLKALNRLSIQFQSFPETLNNQNLLIYPLWCLTNLTSLALRNESAHPLPDLEIAASNLTPLPKLSRLELTGNVMIKDSLSVLTKLSFLNIAQNGSIKDSQIEPLTQFTGLNVNGNNVSFNAVEKIVGLRDLRLCGNRMPGVCELTLTHLELNLYYPVEIPSFPFGVKHFGNLRSLKVVVNTLLGRKIDPCLSQLTNLTSLSFQASDTITDQSIQCLTRLKWLDMNGTEAITLNSLVHLTQLQCLFLRYAHLAPSKTISLLFSSYS